MIAGDRGPTGAAPAPPPWLSSTKLPLLELPAGSSLLRIHRLEHPPVFFSPGSGGDPVGRFDSPTGAFGVLYLAQTFEGAFAETILRNPQRRVVDLAEIASRGISVLGLTRVARLVQMKGAALQALGTDNAISTGPYAPCGAWADALASHPDKPDGLAYASRHDPEQLCVALFSRPGTEIDVLSGPTPLAEMLDEVSLALRRYDKGLA